MTPPAKPDTACRDQFPPVNNTTRWPAWKYFSGLPRVSRRVSCSADGGDQLPILGALPSAPSPPVITQCSSYGEGVVLIAQCTSLSSQMYSQLLIPDHLDHIPELIP